MRKSKRPKSIWTQAFPAQIKEGQRERRDREQRLYQQEAKAWKKLNPLCRMCKIIFGIDTKPHKTKDCHHVYGRGNGLLRRFDLCLPSCRRCHSWVDAHRDAARALGLLAPRGEFNKGPKL